MSFWKKTMDYLGLGPDDAYDDYDDQLEPEPPARAARSSSEGTSKSGRSSTNKNWPTESDETVIRAVPPARPSFPSRDFESRQRQPAPGRRTNVAIADQTARRPRSHRSPRSHPHEPSQAFFAR